MSDLQVKIKKGQNIAVALKRLKKKILKDVREAYQSMTRAWDNAGKKIKENNKRSYWDE